MQVASQPVLVSTGVKNWRTSLEQDALANGNCRIRIREKMLQFSSSVFPTQSPCQEPGPQ